MKKKVLKIISIILLVIAIPTLITIAVLYANDKHLLNEFLNWIDKDVNLSAFIVAIGLYFPFLNGSWKLILNIIASINSRRLKLKNKINKVKIYDDDKNNYIYYDEKNNILDCQFKAPEDVDLKKLVEMTTIELKSKIKMYDKKKS